jgi:hypothetical protein
MAADPNAKKPASRGAAPLKTAEHKGIRIFTYPKIIFIWPSAIVAIICGLGMMIVRNNTTDPRAQAAAVKAITTEPTTEAQYISRFKSVPNLLGLTFLAVFGINLLIMAIDFPRFTIVAIILLIAALVFFLLWLNVFVDFVPPLARFLEHFFVVANSGFYFLFAGITLVIFGIIYVTRYLDYWVILPNEILHNHGPFSDLERFPTFNLKFDKEIPDILEYALLRSGRLVLHVANEPRSIVLDNVLWIDQKETALKQLMRTMEVRVTSDQDVAETT